MIFRNPQLQRRRAALAAAALLAPLIGLSVYAPADAAKSDGCAGGGFSLINLSNGTAVATGAVDRTIPAARFGSTKFGVRGRYISFNIRLSDFAVLNYAFTGAPNGEDITGGRRTPVWASKVPNHRGLSLSSPLTVEMGAGDLVVSRTGAGLSMKIQAKDCAQGGIFQMEPERGDGTRTRITHTLARSATPGMTPFFFDNPNFRAVVGQFLGADCQSIVTGPPSRFCVEGRTRVNIANDFSPDFVVRDSSQVAEQVLQTDCGPVDPVSPPLDHCGRVSIWDVASGGRMGFVTGEDAVELANSPTDCVQNCQAQNRVRGRLVVLGFPFPVPAGSRLMPLVSAQPLPPLLAP